MFSSRSVPEVLTLADLADWPSDSGSWFAVLGHPIKHSISPQMQNAGLRKLAETDKQYSKWQYVRFDVPPEQLPEALEQLHARGFRGLNLTAPHKVIALDCIHSVDTAARPIGAVNTLCWSPAGWEGYNTDGYGLSSGLKEDLGATLAGSHVILLGAGGAARGAAVECLQQGCASLAIANRTAGNLDTLLRALEPLATRTKLRGFDPLQPPADLPKQAWVINATSAGLRADDPLPINLKQLPSPAGVYDMIYNPPRTSLLQQAESLGIPGANGLSMLIHQGARGLEIWTGKKAPVDVMAQAARAALGR